MAFCFNREQNISAINEMIQWFHSSRKMLREACFDCMYRETQAQFNEFDANVSLEFNTRLQHEDIDKSNINGSSSRWTTQPEMPI
jgi:hypothetical protein